MKIPRGILQLKLHDAKTTKSPGGFCIYNCIMSCKETQNPPGDFGMLQLKLNNVGNSKSPGGFCSFNHGNAVKGKNPPGDFQIKRCRDLKIPRGILKFKLQKYRVKEKSTRGFLN
jgi:hypothetical protein